MRTLILAAFLSCTALAGGAGPRPHQQPSQPLFDAFDVAHAHFTGPALPFTVDVDTTKTRQFGKGLLGPRILITAFSPQGWIVVLDSRPLNPGEKLHWEGQLPAGGKWVFRVASADGNGTTSGGDLPTLAEFQEYTAKTGAKAFSLQVVTDERGDIHAQ